MGKAMSKVKGKVAGAAPAGGPRAPTAVEEDVPLDRTDPSVAFAVRAGFNRGAVERYAEADRAEVALPPVDVYRFAGEDGRPVDLLADGGHRYRAYQVNGRKKVPALVRVCSSREEAARLAWAHAAGANAEHGLPRTPEDRRAAVAAVIGRPEYAASPDRELARLCKVGHVLVRLVREELTSRASCTGRRRPRPGTTRQGSVDSGHGVGKTFAAAVAVNWWYDTRDPCWVVTTAPTDRDVKDLLWTEVRLQRLGAKVPLPDDLPPAAAEMRSGPEHVAKGYTARDANSAQGRRRPNVLFVFDEKEGVPAPFWDGMKSMLRPGSGDACLAIGDPLTTTSRAYLEHKAVGLDGSPAWHRVRLSSLDHPNVAAGLKGEPPPARRPRGGPAAGGRSGRGGEHGPRGNGPGPPPAGLAVAGRDSRPRGGRRRLLRGGDGRGRPRGRPAVALVLGVLLRNEVFTWVLLFFESTGMSDVMVFNFPTGNAAAKAQAEANAKAVTGKLALVCPRDPNEPFPSVEMLSVNAAGAEALRALINDNGDRYLERLWVGQSMSAGADTDGSLGGSGKAKFARATKGQLLGFDADNPDETLTTDLVEPAKRFNHPDADFPVRFKSSVPDPEKESLLDSGARLVSAGVRLKADELREAGGFTRPAEGDEVVGGPPQPAPGPGGATPPPGAARRPAADDPSGPSLADLYERLGRLAELVAYQASGFDPAHHPRGKTVPGTNAGSFAPEDGGGDDTPSPDRMGAHRGNKKAVAASRRSRWRTGWPWRPNTPKAGAGPWRGRSCRTRSCRPGPSTRPASSPGVRVPRPLRLQVPAEPGVLGRQPLPQDVRPTDGCRPAGLSRLLAEEEQPTR